MFRIGIVLVFLVLLTTGCARLAADASPGAVFTVQVSPAGVDAAEPVTAGAPDGSLYVAWVNHGDNNQADVMLRRYNHDGKAQGSPVRVNQQAGIAKAWRGDPPSIAATDHAVYVLWTANVESEGKKGTDLFLSTSHDGGQTFAAAVKVNDDRGPTSHGMHSLAVAPDGRIYVAWLDERNVPAPQHTAKAEGHHMESNSELFIAYSNDGGKTFSANRKVAADTCPCCKTDLTVAPDGTLYASWRQVLPGNFRHIAVASSTDGGANFSSPVIVSDDKWMLQGCPVSGPSISTDANGTLKVVWFAAGEGDAPGLYFAESRDKGRTFTPRSLLMQESVKGTPALASGGNREIAIWQGSTGQTPDAKAREVGGAGSAISLASNAELPAAVLANDKLFVAYIQRVNEKRSVWFVSSSSSVSR